MHYYSRRHFIKSTTGLIGWALAPGLFDFKKDKPLLSFSTLGCPDWSFQTIVSFASENKYNGIEIRGLQRELDLTRSAAFSSGERILDSRKLAEDKGLKIIALGSSAQLHHTEEKERLKNLNEAKRFIDLAFQLNCPYVRVFPNNFPADRDRSTTMETIVNALRELSDHARGSKVRILMETHGDVVKASDIEKIMKDAEDTGAGLVWDIYNMWSITKEPPSEVFSKLKNYICHTHIKDAEFTNGKEKYTLVGKGGAPIFEAIDILRKGGYGGYYSFEWEKMWRPEIEEPEIALADYQKIMNRHFRK